MTITGIEEAAIAVEALELAIKVKEEEAAKEIAGLRQYIAEIEKGIAGRPVSAVLIYKILLLVEGKATIQGLDLSGLKSKLMKARGRDHGNG